MPLDPRTRWVILACPFLFILHEAEEYLTALPWIEKHIAIIPPSIARIIPDSPAFIAYAAVGFFVLFMLAALLALRSKPGSLAWLLFAILITARLENAILHTLESLALMEYAPGVITAVLLVAPITIDLMRRLMQLELISRSALFVIIPVGFVAQTAGIAVMLMLG